MTANDQLKAELAQLAADNQRLREALQLSQMAVEQALEEDLIPAGETGGQRDFWRHARARNYIALQTPPTPGLGAAMLRVVEAAKVIVSHSYRVSSLDALEAWLILEEYTQDLNKLEAK